MTLLVGPSPLFTGTQVNYCLVCPTRTLGCARSLLAHSAV